MEDAKLRKIGVKIESAIKTELPDLFRPERSMEHEIIIDAGEKISFRGLYRLSPDELTDTKIFCRLTEKSPYSADRKPIWSTSRFFKYTWKSSTGSCELQITELNYKKEQLRHFEGE